MLRKTLSFFAALMLTFLLLTTAATTFVAVSITPKHINSWLSESGTYDNAIDALALSVPKEQNDKLLTEADLKTAAKAALTPAAIQNLTESFVNGTFEWLEGKNNKPTYTLDLSSAKQTFATELGKIAAERYKSLPVCKNGASLPDNKDILSATCRVAGYDATPAINKVVADISESKELLEDTVITADSLTITDPNGQKKNVYDQIKYMPTIYQLSKFAPYVFGFLALCAIIVLVLLSASRKRGMRRAAFSLIFSALIIFLGIWLAGTGLRTAETKVAGKSLNEPSALAQTTAVSVGKQINEDFARISMYFGVTFAVSGVAMLVISSKSQRFKDQKSNEPPKDEMKEHAPLTVAGTGEGRPTAHIPAQPAEPEAKHEPENKS